ncbi:MAG: hypothetical protein D6679_12665 [Candidatus Hydrogenedentota bacterium]|nr:MAG: hypothetical protein D6679_12665 [Candidatus Hydrogenedentota bacterium]
MFFENPLPWRFFPRAIPEIPRGYPEIRGAEKQNRNRPLFPHTGKESAIFFFRKSTTPRPRFGEPVPPFLFFPFVSSLFPLSTPSSR